MWCHQQLTALRNFQAIYFSQRASEGLLLARERGQTAGPKDPSPPSHVALITNGSCRGGVATSWAVREARGAGLGGWDGPWAGLAACTPVSEKWQTVPSLGGGPWLCGHRPQGCVVPEL